VTRAKGGTRRNGASRAGFLLLGLAALAQVVSFQHLAAVPHEVCPVHDELVHGEHRLGDHDREHARDQADGSSAHWSSSEEQEQHDPHCGIVLLLRRGQPVLASEGSAHRCARAPESPGQPPLAVEAVRRFPLYLLAPKASPPLVG
jgi:hypothetical protein